MLSRERNRLAIVHPSWVQMDYEWDRLDQLLNDPELGRMINPRNDWGRLGYPATIQPYKLMAGPEGGGIALIEMASGEKSLIPLYLAGEAAIRPALVPMPDPWSDAPQVFYLEPPDGPLRNIPFAPKSMRSRARRFVCRVGIKHIEPAGDSAFWLIRSTQDPGVGDDSAAVVALARGFGLEVEPLAELPTPVAEEVGRLLVAEDEAYLRPINERRQWFVVKNDGKGLSLHTAILVYVSFHLRQVWGKRMFSAHLLGRIEGGSRGLD